MKANIKTVAVVILAAGESSRMQQAKQLLPWGNTTLLGTAIDAAKGCGEHDVFVVLGAKAALIKTHFVETNVTWVLNGNWIKGMGSSISKAMGFLLEREKEYNAVLFMLCDQPLVNAGYLKEMIQTFYQHDKGIVATSYQQNKGVPVIFNKTYFKRLKGLDGANGARNLINDNLGDVFGILPKGIEKDLDTIEEYEQALNKHT